ncbi:MAG: Asp-tRNA(Asn)/Glu-tRNA(Gln) amidotransferase subunit GatB [Deltaproteobacteria bacterium]|nr:Asp-tRNA(Asn)/Glu-tRNA(Gln) amidotransferase subunit GatB [Deltaproteobacteria bacterium]
MSAAMERYEAVIGLEVHAQLLTDSKLFCGCSTRFGASPNTQVCPVCLGMPGVLPALNEKAVLYAIKMALSVDCTVNRKSVFARKNYFYPDLPKGYQISQYDEPLAKEGSLEIDAGEGKKRVGITRVHMEEDAGKLLHGEGPAEEGFSFVDLNRTGVALIEIVSEPDIRTPDEAVAYLKSLRDILVYLEICDGNMQEGSLRCDGNVSIRPFGEAKLGVKAELKNMNSFKFLKDALAYEINRQTELVIGGKRVIQETRLFDPATGATRPMRTKEAAHDYRYFPEPDLLPLVVTEEEVEDLRKTLPELPARKKERFEKEYSISPYDSGVLVSSKRLADFYEQTVKRFNEPKTVANWVMGDFLRLLNENSKDVSESPVTPGKLAKLLSMIKEGAISGKIAKEVFEEMFKTGKDADAIVKGGGLTQISDEGELAGIVEGVIGKNPSEVEKYRAGKTNLLGFFVGEVMKLTKGRANPQLVSELIKKRLG